VGVGDLEIVKPLESVYEISEAKLKDSIVIFRKRMKGERAQI
jgi:hypothetical protein